MFRRALAYLILPALLAQGCYIASFDDEPLPEDQGIIEDDAEIEPVAAYEATARIALDSDEPGAEVFATIAPDGSVSFRGEVTCEPANAICNASWTFPEGEIIDGDLEPGARTFAEGFHHAVLTVRTLGDEVVARAHAYIAAWSGTFTDNFNRGALEAEARGWVPPRNPYAEYMIKDDWLYLKHDIQAPGSTGLMAYPIMRDSHVEVTVRRHPDTLSIHYMDVIFRADPHARYYRFYRVRIDQGAVDQGGWLRIAVFKIYDEEDEHGLLISDVTQPVNDFDALLDCEQATDCESLENSWARNCQQGKCTPIYCVGCEAMMSYDAAREQDFRILIDFHDDAQGRPSWEIAVVNPDEPSEVFVSQNVVDLSPDPHTHAGLVGLAHFDLETYFDDFVIERLDPQ